MRAQVDFAEKVMKELRDKGRASGNLVNTNMHFCPTGVEVRVHDKGDNTQWAFIPPIVLSQQCPPVNPKYHKHDKKPVSIGRPDLTATMYSDYDNHEISKLACSSSMETSTWTRSSGTPC